MPDENCFTGCSSAGIGQHAGHRPPTWQARHQAVPQLAGQCLGFGSKRRHVQLDGMVQINKVVFAHLEADTMRGAVESVLDFLPIEQRPHYANIGTE